MKKKMMLAVLLGILILGGNGWADYIPLLPGDQVQVFWTPTTYGGGPFTVTFTKGSTTYNFKTFCIEGSVYLGNSGTFYTVGSISHSVISGGANNTYDPPGYLSYAAAAIYSDWLSGKSVTGATDEDYQRAIWWAEKENGGVANTVWNTFKDASGYSGVYALNINFLDVRESQSLLIKDPVPEPVSMLLFGTGLVAAGGYVRRKMKK